MTPYALHPQPSSPPSPTISLDSLHPQPSSLSSPTISLDPLPPHPSILSVDLKLCLHPRLIMAFTTFLLGRGLKRGSIINHFKALINVVKWLKRNRQQEEAEVRAVV